MAGEGLIAKVGLAALAKAEELLPAVEEASTRGLSFLDIVGEGSANVGKAAEKVVGGDSVARAQAKAMTFEERLAAASQTPVQKVQFAVNEVEKTDPRFFNKEPGVAIKEAWPGQFESEQTDRNLKWLLKNTDAARLNKVESVLRDLDQLPAAEQMSPRWTKILKPHGVKLT